MTKIACRIRAFRKSSTFAQFCIFFSLFNFFRLAKKYGLSKKWVYFCEDSTQIDLKGLLTVLNGFNAHKVCDNQ